MYADSHLSTFTFILYTCIWIPLHHTTRALVKIFAFFLDPHLQLSEETSPSNLDLPVSRYSECSSRHDGEEETCSICLVEFEKQDSVHELRRCGHIFHVECMEKWLETCRFTCPLCRSILLQNPTPSCKTWSYS